MTNYSGVFVLNGSIRRIVFEASSQAEAEEMAKKWNVGIEGVAQIVNTPAPIPEAYDAKTACKLLGGVSRQTLYRDLVVGLLQRVPHTRRVLITRKSLERRIYGKAA